MVQTVLIRTWVIAIALAASGCDRSSEAPPAAQSESGGGSVPTNRVDIPAPVRANLGITFAKVERRNVAATLRVPGQFELLPDARREYRAPLAGRVEVLVSQFQRVERGTLLYRLDAPGWRELQQQISAAGAAVAQTRARLEATGPLREAHRRHEQSLAAKIALWQERLEKLEAMRSEGAGGGTQIAEVRGTLIATQAELADAQEKDADLAAREQSDAAELAAAEARSELLLRTAAALAGVSMAEIVAPVMNGGGAGGAGKGVGVRARWQEMAVLEVRASGPGVVETTGIVSGGLGDERSLVVSVVQPERLRFRARGLQSDLSRLRDGLPTRVVAAGDPVGAGAEGGMAGTLSIGLRGDPDERTIDLFTTPAIDAGGAATLAREGMFAQMEITLSGGTVELAVPSACIARDGARPIVFRRDPKNPDVAIRIDADVGITDGRWTVLQSGVREGDEIVLGGVYQLALATGGGGMPKGGHFHPDGTYHEGDH